MPNMMQMIGSYVVTDPKGENLKAVGRLLESKGYEVKVLDLINMEKSHCYNPFVYLRDDNDVQRLATNLFKSTKSVNSAPEPKVPEATVTGFFHSTPAMFTLMFIRFPPP